MKTTITDRPASAAVIIPHYNDIARLDRCLRELARNDLTDVEIVVVDNGSTESLEEVRASHPEFRFLAEPEKGAAAARNRGIAETTAPLLLFIDADCVPDRDWVRIARKHLGWYCKGLPKSAEFRSRVMRAADPETVKSLLRGFYQPIIERMAA